MCNGAFYGSADSGEVCIDIFSVVGQFTTGWFLMPGEHTGADVAEVGKEVHAGQSLGQTAGLPSVGVVARARHRRTHCDEVPIQGGGDLEVESGVDVLVAVEVGAMPPVPARDQGAVYQDRAGSSGLGRTEHELGQDGFNDLPQRVPTTRHRGLAHPEHLSRDLLHDVLTK